MLFFQFIVKGEKIVKIFNIIFSILVIVGLICTGSRVVYLFGLFEGLCLFIISFVYSKNKKYHIIIDAGVTLTLIIVIFW